jgi:hypothetical protein
MVKQRRKSQVASLPKNSFWRMGELQPVLSPNPYNSSSMPVRFWEVPKKKQEVDFDLLCRLVPGAGLQPILLHLTSLYYYI